MGILEKEGDRAGAGLRVSHGRQNCVDAAGSAAGANAGLDAQQAEGGRIDAMHDDWAGRKAPTLISANVDRDALPRCAPVAPPAEPSDVDAAPADRESFFEHHFHALIVLDRRGSIMDANAAARQEIADGRIGVFSDGAMRFGSRECARRFQAGLIEAGSQPTSWRRLVVRMADGEWRLVSVRALGRDNERTLVEVHAGAADQDADVEPLAQAFALTASEAAVLAHLLQALAPKEIADIIGISSHTVRAHMRAIYAKLGVRARSGVMKTALRLVS